MGVSDAPDPLDPLIGALIRNKARRLLGKEGLTREDAEDVAQDLYVACLERLGAFDRGRGDLRAFAGTVLDRCVSNILRARRAKKRDYRRACSFGPAAGRDGSVSDPGDVSQPPSDVTPPADERADLRADVEGVLGVLPPELRELAARLMGKTKAEVARETGRRPATLRDQIRRLREPFERAGLREYL